MLRRFLIGFIFTALVTAIWVISGHSLSAAPTGWLGMSLVAANAMVWGGIVVRNVDQDKIDKARALGWQDAQADAYLADVLDQQAAARGEPDPVSSPGPPSWLRK